MGEIHDFKHPEDDEKPGRDGKQYCGGRDDVQNECCHAGLRVASMQPKSGMSLLGASGKWERLAPLKGTRNRLRQSRDYGTGNSPLLRGLPEAWKLVLLTRSELRALLARTDVREALHDLHRTVSLHLPEIHRERRMALGVHLHLAAGAVE